VGWPHQKSGKSVLFSRPVHRYLDSVSKIPPFFHAKPSQVPALLYKPLSRGTGSFMSIVNINLLFWGQEWQTPSHQ
jgi:hypothetical protein